MANFSKGDWVTYRTDGYSVTKLVLAVKPDGTLVTGDHEHDSDNHHIHPEHRDVSIARD